MGPPGGGPEDRTPPEVMESTPLSGSVKVAPDATIKVLFSKPVDQASLENALFISPPQSKPPKVKIHGSRATIILADSIPRNGALVLTVGTGVRDLHGNPLKTSFTVALTSGEHIPGGKITGRVYATDAVQGVLVGAWETHDTAAVRPDVAPPLHISQTDLDGRFSLDYLPAGTYRLLCWDSRAGDRKYAPGVDRLGICWKDVELEADSVRSLNLFTVKRDTLELAPAYVSAPDKQHLVVRMNKPVGSALNRFLTSISLTDTTGRVLSVRTSWMDPSDSSKIWFLTDPQDSSREYRASFAGDTSGFTFTGSSLSDSAGPKLSSSFPKSGERDTPALAAGWVAFDDALESAKFADFVSLTIYDSISAPIEVAWAGANVIGWKVLKPLEVGTRCKLSVVLSGLHDRQGNVGADTTWSATFSIADPALMGSIGGQVQGADSLTVLVGTRSIGGFRSKERTATAKPDGSYTIEGLDPGRYVVRSWVEREPDGVYTEGGLNPLLYSEPFAFRPDTVTVRARWESGGIDIILPPLTPSGR